MSEKLMKLGIERETAYLYFVRDGAVWRIARSEEAENRMPELVNDAGARMSSKHVLYLDADGDISRVLRSATPDKPRPKNAPHAASRSGEEPAGKAAAAKRAKARKKARKAPAKEAAKREGQGSKEEGAEQEGRRKD